MANEYATIEEAKARVVVKVAPSSPEETDLNGIREAASRAVDDYLGVPAATFIPSDTPETKRLYGNRSSFMTIPLPLRGDVTIVAPDGYTVPNFTLEKNRLITLTEAGLRDPFLVWGATYFDVTGLWGYEEIPAQVKEATLQLISHFWLGRGGQPVAGSITDVVKDGQYPERDYPRRTRRLLDEFAKTLNFEESAKGSLYIA